MNIKPFNIFILVFTTSLTVSCKNTQSKKHTKVTKKNHLQHKRSIVPPKKIIINAKKELQKETPLIVSQKPTKEKVRPCAVDNGEGKKFLKTNDYGKCIVASCDSGFKKWKNGCFAICKEDEAFYNGKCNPVIAECSIDGQDGEQVWDGDHYGRCISSEKFSISANHSELE